MKTNSYENHKSLEERNAFYRKLLFNSPDLIFQFTLTKNKTIFFPYLSKSVITHFDLRAVEKNLPALESLKSRIITEDFKAFMESVLKAKKALNTWEHEFRAKIPSKGTKWFKGVATVEKEENGDINFFGKITDITCYKEQEKKIKLSEQRYLFALEASSEGIWDYDVKKKTVFYSSQTMKMLGYEAKDTVDSIFFWDNNIHPDDKVRYFKDVQDHIDEKTPYYENTQRMLTKKGEYKWVLSRGKIIERDDTNLPLRIIGTHSDISIQKEREENLIRTLQIVEEQNSRLLNFAHIVSHNLRSHSGNIEMLLEIIEEENESEQLSENFTYLKASSKALSQTIEHLKELVGIQTVLVNKKENLNINDFVAKTLDILAEEISKNKVIINNSIPENETISYNPAYLESILLNFTSNAIRYSHPDRNPIISYSITTNENKRVLHISDNGLGINLEKHGKKLFGMYKTFHNHKDSRGIGLFITKNQIEAMGGNVSVDSEVGVGTTFNIYFNA